MSPSKQEETVGEGSVAVTLGGHSRCSIFTFGEILKEGPVFLFFLSFRIGLGSFASCPRDHLDFPKHKRGLR